MSLAPMRFFRRFARATEGATPVEGVFSILLLVVWLALSLQFVEAIRAKSVNEKAADTISDLVTREKQIIGPKYVDELFQLYQFLTNTTPELSWIRVTGVNYSTANARYEVLWSYATSGRQSHTTASLQSEASRLTTLEAGKMLVLVETSQNYIPFMGKRADGNGFGLSTTNIWLSKFVARHPRENSIEWNAQY